jgi:hypothetical protein
VLVEHVVGESLEVRVAKNGKFTGNVPIPIGIAATELKIPTSGASVFVRAKSRSVSAGLFGAWSKRYRVISVSKNSGWRQDGKSALRDDRFGRAGVGWSGRFGCEVTAQPVGHLRVWHEGVGVGSGFGSGVGNGVSGSGTGLVGDGSVAMDDRARISLVNVAGRRR